MMLKDMVELFKLHKVTLTEQAKNLLRTKYAVPLEEAIAFAKVCWHIRTKISELGR
jgi:hypothetical protein